MKKELGNFFSTTASGVISAVFAGLFVLYVEKNWWEDPAQPITRLSTPSAPTIELVTQRSFSR